MQQSLQPQEAISSLQKAIFMKKMAEAEAVDVEELLKGIHAEAELEAAVAVS